jgi:hypothetical protein
MKSSDPICETKLLNFSDVGNKIPLISNNIREEQNE